MQPDPQVASRRTTKRTTRRRRCYPSRSLFAGRQRWCLVLEQPWLWELEKSSHLTELELLKHPLGRQWIRRRAELLEAWTAGPQLFSVECRVAL